MAHVSDSSQRFAKSFRRLILLAWTVPAIVGFTVLMLVKMFTPAQVWAIVTSPLEGGFVLLSLVAAHLYFTRFIRPVTAFLADRAAVNPADVLARMRSFSLRFWIAFIGYLLLAPASVIITAELYTDFVATAAHWFRIHLVALIVSIIVGLPIYFMIIDLFGRNLAGLPLDRPHLTIKAKVFLIGALVPLLIDTTLVQFFWAKTGRLENDTVIIWLILEVLAIGGSLLFARSFAQSMRPMESMIGHLNDVQVADLPQIEPQSTDELGVFANDLLHLARRLRVQGDVLAVRNALLASSDGDDGFEDSFSAIIDLCDTALGSDVTHVMIPDAPGKMLIEVARSHHVFNAAGYVRLRIAEKTLATRCYRSGETMVIADAPNDPRVDATIVSELGVRSAIAAPMKIGDRVAGVLISTSTKSRRSYGDRERELVEGLAQEAALVLHSLRLQQERMRLAGRYREFNERAPDPIVLVDESHRIAELNRAASRALGAEGDELLGQALPYLGASEDDRDRLAVMLDQVGEGGAERAEISLQRVDGSDVILFDVHASRVSLGDASVRQLFLRDVTEQRRAEATIRHSERELSAILDQMQETFFRTDRQARLIRISKSIEMLLGCSAEELLGREIQEVFFDPSERERIDALLRERGRELKGHQVALRHRDGSTIWASIYMAAYEDDSQRFAGYEGTASNITHFLTAQQELHHEKERAQVTLESIADGVVTTDHSGAIEYMNPVAEELSGWQFNEAVGRPFDEVFVLIEEVSRRRIDNPVDTCMRSLHPVSSRIDTVLLSRYGRDYAIEYTAAPIRGYDQADSEGTVIGLHDVTEMRRMAQQLTYQASHDALTGLINRREFEERLQKALESARLEDGEHALCYLDLDQFKIVNDTCGHVAGDELLKQVAERLRSQIRKADTLARLGGDEFGVLLWDCPTETALRVTNAMREVIRDYRFSWQDRSFDVGASIGLVPIKSDSGNLTDILSAADSACYVAKDHGRNRVHVYEADDRLVAERHGEMQWVARARQALEEDRLLLYGQAIVSLAEPGDHVDHYEVLVRMRDEEGKTIPPMAFIPAAERYHLMPALDRWVIGNAIEILGDKDIAELCPGLKLNINLSGQSLSDNDLLEFVIGELLRRAVDPTKICFEITETSAVANLVQATRFMGVLEALGCRFALDDFGSGLSSFGYLRNLSVESIKIDGSFVRDVLVDHIDLAMVQSINTIGHTLGLKTVAEFVETQEIAAKLREIGVDMAQGYAIDRPKPLREAIIERARAMGRFRSNEERAGDQ